MAKDSVFEISPGVISEEVMLGETLLMNVHTLAYFRLDALGTRLWRAMQTSDNEAEVVREVAGETGLEAAGLAAQLEAMLAGMERCGLIVRRGS